MKLKRTLIVIFITSLLFVVCSYKNLIDDICKKSNDYKLCVDFVRADLKSSSADKKGLTRILIQLFYL